MSGVLKSVFEASQKAQDDRTEEVEQLTASLQSKHLTNLASVGKVGSTVSVLGSMIVRGGKVSPPVENGDANLTLTEADHADRMVMQIDVAADRTYSIPAPSAAGVTYRLVGQGSGSAADGHDIILDNATTVFFDGAITHLDTGGNAAGVWGNGTSENRLQINVPAAYDLTLVAKSTTVMYITGTVTSGTAPAFAAQ